MNKIMILITVVVIITTKPTKAIAVLDILAITSHTSESLMMARHGRLA